jgi:SPP1 family predicted phage head-tail adaptor
MPRTLPNLRETLVIQDGAPDPVAVTSLTRASLTATVQTATPHGLTNGDFVTITGAVPAGYNGKRKATVTGASSFTFPVTDGALATPATGTITATYATNAQGQVIADWDDVATIFGEQLPVRASERLAAQAIQTTLDYRFRVHVRGDLNTRMRVRWTPQWPPDSVEHLLEIHGIAPEEDGQQFMILDCGEVA